MRVFWPSLLIVFTLLGVTKEAHSRSVDLWIGSDGNITQDSNSSLIRGYQIDIAETTEIAGLEWHVNIPVGTSCAAKVWNMGGVVRVTGTTIHGTGKESWETSHFDASLYAGSSYIVGFSCTDAYNFDHYITSGAGALGAISPYISNHHSLSSSTDDYPAQPNQYNALMRLKHHLEPNPDPADNSTKNTNYSRGYTLTMDVGTYISAVEVQGDLLEGEWLAARVYDANGVLVRSGSQEEGAGPGVYRSYFPPYYVASGNTYTIVIYATEFSFDWTDKGTAAFLLPVFSSNSRAVYTLGDSFPTLLTSVHTKQWWILRPSDKDGDGVSDSADNCPNIANSDQVDGDGDGTGDLCDACTDTDEDGYGNPGYPSNTCSDDNCPSNSNPGQEDFDGDGVGYACDLTCAASMNFLHDFNTGEVFDLQASGPIVYEGLIAAGADISLNGGGGVALNNEIYIDLGAILSIFTTGCNPE